MTTTIFLHDPKTLRVSFPYAPQSVAAIAQAAALAEDNAKLRAELEKAQNGHAFYMGMYAEEKGAQR